MIIKGENFVQMLQQQHKQVTTTSNNISSKSDYCFIFDVYGVLIKFFMKGE